MLTRSIRLSKSKLASFEHCAKRLWLQVHRRQDAHFDPATLAKFKFGHEVGDKARSLVPDGVLIDTGLDMAAALQQTADLINGGHQGPIFEATFLHENVLVRVDILQPADDGGWELIEVKGSSRVGGYHLADVATQVWVARGWGLNITKATVRHLISRVNWSRPDISSVMFKDADVTNDIARFIANRAKIAAEAQATVESAQPERSMGLHCYRPLACEFRGWCNANTI